MNIVGILVALVVITFFFIVLNKILDKALPAVGLDASWKGIVLGICGLIVLIAFLKATGYTNGWF